MRTASRSVLRLVPYCAASSRSPGSRSLGFSIPFKIWLRRSRKIVAAMLVEGGARCSMGRQSLEQAEALGEAYSKIDTPADMYG